MSKDAASTVNDIAREMARVPERLEDARQALDDWTADIEKIVKKNPVRSVVGAFALGYVVARLGRYL